MTAIVPWAKAPSLADRPDLREALRAATAADRREYLEAGFCPVACAACGAEVSVRKHSMVQTSVQWTAEATARCPRFAEQTVAGGRTGPMEGCPNLTESIVDAVRRGTIEVPDA